MDRAGGSRTSQSPHTSLVKRSLMEGTDVRVQAIVYANGFR
jgi:hypothetical protein